MLKPASALSELIAEAIEGTSPIVRRTVTLGGARPRHLGVTVSPIAAPTAVSRPSSACSPISPRSSSSKSSCVSRRRWRGSANSTAGLAHEFRNGLATIHGYGRLLDPDTLPEQARTCVNGIRAETVALGDVVTNFLRFARPEQITLAPVDLQGVIIRAVGDVPNAGDAVSVDGPTATVDGDDVLLLRAFSNLIRNSLEACADAGIAPRS